MSNINNNILSSIELLLEHKMNTLYADKTFPSVIYAVNDNNTYTVIKDKQKRIVPNALGITLTLGQKVWVKIPCNNLELMHICGIRN